MIGGERRAGEGSLPAGYHWLDRVVGAVTHLRVIAADGGLAASGYAAAFGNAFAYDRIYTSPDHRRLGLGTALMERLGVSRPAHATNVLTATAAGRGLYEALRWRVLSAWSTAGVRR